MPYLWVWENMANKESLEIDVNHIHALNLPTLGGKAKKILIFAWISLEFKLSSVCWMANFFSCLRGNAVDVVLLF